MMRVVQMHTLSLSNMYMEAVKIQANIKLWLYDDQISSRGRHDDISNIYLIGAVRSSVNLV